MVTRPTASLADARKVLAIGDDPGARELLTALGPAGIELVAATDGGSGLKSFYAERPDLVVLDLDLEDVDGLEILSTIREMSDVPVIAITGHDGSAERAGVLRAGADDCMTKPFVGAELLARVEALLRRACPDPRQAAAVLEDEYVRIDRVRYRVEVLGSEVALTPTEFRMLAAFVEHPGRVLGHAQLLELVWGGGFRDRDEVKLYVSYLRRKLGNAAGVNPVETVRGIGYRYRPHKGPP